MAVKFRITTVDWSNRKVRQDQFSDQEGIVFYFTTFLKSLMCEFHEAERRITRDNDVTYFHSYVTFTRYKEWTLLYENELAGKVKPENKITLVKL